MLKTLWILDLYIKWEWFWSVSDVRESPKKIVEKTGLNSV